MDLRLWRRFWDFSIGLNLIALCCSHLWAQSVKPDDLAVGKLLVCPRDAPDPAFAKTVVLLVQFDKTSVVGLILNRPTTVPVSEALHDVKSAANRSDRMYVGGPVEMNAVLAVFRANAAPEGAARVFGQVFLASSRPTLEKALGTVKSAEELRIYAGYCGWVPGQLENEVKLGGWYIFDRKPEAIFDAHPETLWTRLIERTELQMASLKPRLLIPFVP